MSMTMRLLFYTLFLSHCDVNSFSEPKQNRHSCDCHHIRVSGCRVPGLKAMVGLWRDPNSKS
jgi:hypothetical protein